MADQTDAEFMADWAKTSGLTSKTLDILTQQEIISKSVLLTLSIQDVDMLSLTVGQRSMLIAGIDSLNPAATLAATPAAISRSSTSSVPIVNTKTLASNEALNAALETLKNTHLSDLLDVETSVGSKDNASTGKLLHIPDYVTHPESSSKSSEREIAKGVVIRTSGKSKMCVEEVNEAQWISANVLILLELIDDMDLPTIKEYLRYTAKAGDYLQICTPASVMKLDEAHRKAVAEGRADAWDKISSDHCFFFLKKKKPDEESDTARKSGQSYSQSYSKNPRRYPTDARTGKPVCFDFNKPQGCHKESCGFAHVCQVSGCGGDHPRFQHSYPPRFREKSSYA